MPPGDPLFARALTFHVGAEEAPSVIDALDRALARYRRIAGFQGLLCLEHGGLRPQVMIVTLWDRTGLGTTADDAEEARRLIAEVTDIGVTSRTYEVLGFLPGSHRGGVAA